MSRAHKKRKSNAVPSAFIDWDAFVDRADQTLTRNRIRRFRALLAIFRSDRTSIEPATRQLARQIEQAVGGRQ